MIICIGPFCIPVIWGIPFFAALFMSVKNYVKRWLFGTPEQAVLPEPSKQGEVVVHVESSEQMESLLKNNKLLMVDFSAAWCQPCKAIFPVYAELSSRFPDISFLKVDVDELEDVAVSFKVTAVPTFIAVREGQEVERLLGANKNDLENLVVMLSKLQ
jgi:thioredoxin 1